ncbi:hypothetical protein B0H11DRAFT_1301731 [Mycena galericulata]|nr:hypothetical protein B0H11DRAFT_1301731 [Mycena galericulata]
MSYNNTRRWADQYPNQGSPSLDTLAQYHNIRDKDVGRARSTAFGREHQYDPNPQERFDEFTHAMQEAYADSRTRPIMGGQAHDTVTYHTTYGVSAPLAYSGRQRATRKNVISGRLAAIEPHHLHTSIRRKDGNGNVVGACCEYLTLQPYLSETAGTLRTIKAVAREISNGRDRRFCEKCRIFAINATRQFVGLRIIDGVSGEIYESEETAAAYATAESRQAYEQQALANQQQAVHADYLAQQMSRLSVAPQTMPTTVQYCQQGQIAAGFPVAGPSGSSHGGGSGSSSRRNKTTLRY